MGNIGHSVRYYPPWTFPTFPSISAGIEGCDGKDLLDLKVDWCTLLLSHATLLKIYSKCKLKKITYGQI